MSFLQKLDMMTWQLPGYRGGGGGGNSATSTTNIDPDIKRRVTPALDVAQQTYEQELGIGTDGPGLGQQRHEAGLSNLQGALGVASQDAGTARGVAGDQLGLAQDIAGQRGRFGAGLAEQASLAQDAIAGRGIYDDTAAVNRQLANLQGQQLAGGQGSLGSARADRARQSALADASLQLQDRRQAQAQGGAQALAGLGQQAQQAALTGQQLSTGAAQQLQQAGEAGVNVAQAQRGLAQGAYDVPHESLSRFFGYLGSAPQGQSTTQKQGGGK